MTWTKRIFIFLGLLVFVLLISAFFAQNYVFTNGITSYAGVVDLEAIGGEVNIHRDSLGIPHIVAENDSDLYFATGFVMAQDRLWQMDLFRHVTTGRISELFGDEFIKTDLLFRSLEIPEKSKMVIDSLPPDILQSLSCFTKGVNTYLNIYKDKLPMEFIVLQYIPEKWEIIHTMNLIGYMAWDLTLPWENEMKLYKIFQKTDSSYVPSFLPQSNTHNSFIFSEFQQNKIDSAFQVFSQVKNLNELTAPIFQGSNNWAVSGKKSGTGKPLLANDMHLSLFSPGIWYQMHQTIRGKLNVTGVALAGAPFVIAGHNDSIAWGMTNVMIDDMDFYMETLNPQKNMYRFNGKWHVLKEKEVKIKSKSGKIVEEKLRFTHRGPVISKFHGINNKVISMRWIGNEYSNEVRAAYLVNRANNIDDFKNAYKTFIAISQNVAYADVKGNIGLFCCAGLPKREHPGRFVYPGDTSLFDWKGLVPFDSLPHVINPEKGYVCSANNKTIGDEYPHFISHWYDMPWRYNRICQLLEEKEIIDVKDMQNIQTDRKSALAAEMVPEILKIMENKTNDTIPLFQKAVDELKNWDFTYKAELAAPALFDVFYLHLALNLFTDELGDSLATEITGSKNLVKNIVANCWKNSESPWIDNIRTSEKEVIADIALLSFAESVNELSYESGGEYLLKIWGDIHQFKIEHPIGKVNIMDKLFHLNTDKRPIGGSFHTVSPYTYKFNDPYKVYHGASHRHVYACGFWDSSKTVIPTGVSGVSSSPFYCNQTPLYINDLYHDEYFTENALKENTVYTLCLKHKGNKSVE